MQPRSSKIVTTINSWIFIELIFKWQRLWDFNINPHGLLKNVNEFIEVDDLPYYLTEFVFSRPESPKSGLPPGVGVFQSSTQIETYPPDHPA